MLSRAIAAVAEFHKTFSVPIESKPTIPSRELSVTRMALLQEEVDELLLAEYEQDIVEIADGLGDILYIVIGTALAYGIPLDDVFEAIHKNNLTKLFPDGKPRFDETRNYKIMKPPNFKPVDLRPILFPNGIPL